MDTRPSRTRRHRWSRRAIGACLIWACLAAPAATAPTGAGASAGQGPAAADDIARLRAARRAHPADAATAAQLGLLLFQKDRASLEAQGLLETASRALADRHDVHLALLESYLSTRKLDAAASLLTRVQPQQDASTRFAFDTLYRLIESEQFTMAQPLWQRVYDGIQARSATAPQPDAAEALFLQGLLATAAERKDEALAAFRRADSQGFPPLESPQLVMLADAFFWLQEYNLAAATYEEALKHFPDNRQARLRYGVALYWSTQFNKAKEALEPLVREAPDQLEANYYLGATLLSMKLYDQAEPRFERELVLDPKCDRCMSALGYLAYLAGDDARASSWLDKAVALHSSMPEIGTLYGMIAIRAGKYDVAVQHLARVVAQAPKFAHAHFQLAIAYQRLGNSEKAKEHANIYKQLSTAEGATTP